MTLLLAVSPIWAETHLGFQIWKDLERTSMCSWQRAFRHWVKDFSYNMPPTPNSMVATMAKGGLNGKQISKWPQPRFSHRLQKHLHKIYESTLNKLDGNDIKGHITMLFLVLSFPLSSILVFYNCHKHYHSGLKQRKCIICSSVGQKFDMSFTGLKSSCL